MSENKTAHSSPSDIVNTFNTFFSSVPANRSFDMTYKVYIRDMADTEDRSNLSTTNSVLNLQGAPPVTIASHGIVPVASASSTRLDQFSAGSVPTSKSSSTNLKSTGSESTDWVSMSQIDRMCSDNMARKQRSMINLTDLNKKLGYSYSPPPFASTPPTIYENLSILEKTVGSVGFEAFAKKDDAFEKVLKSDSAVELYIRVSDCFD